MCLRQMCPRHMGRRDLDPLHDPERLRDLQRVAEPALYVSPLDDAGRVDRGGIAWHISVMWVLFVDGSAYLLYGFFSGHFHRDIRPCGPHAVTRDMWAALTGGLAHRRGHYNAVQRPMRFGRRSTCARQWIS